MIAEQIINLIFAVATAIFNTIRIMAPSVNMGTYLYEYTIEILKICTQGANFVKFMVGDLAVPLIEMTIMLLLYKYTIFPIIQFIRSIFVNSN